MSRYYTESFHLITQLVSPLLSAEEFMSYEIKIKIDQPKIVVIISVLIIIAAGIGLYTEKLKVNDLAIVFATILGPIFAIQIQSFREGVQRSIRTEHEKNEEKLQRQRLAFRQMMAYRANPLDSMFVQALNVIPVDFQGVESVVNAWKLYFGQLCKNKNEDPNWDEHSNDFRAQLLGSMATHLGYSFTTQELKDERYFAQAHLDDMVMKAEILKGAHRIFANDYPFTVLAYVKDAPESNNVNNNSTRVE